MKRDRGFGFLSKPFMPQLLIEAVKEILLRAAKRPPGSSQASSRNTLERKKRQIS